MKSDTDILLEAQENSIYKHNYHGFVEFRKKYGNEVQKILQDKTLTENKKVDKIIELIIEKDIRQYIREQKQKGLI